MVAVGDGRVLDGASVVIDRGLVSELWEDGRRLSPGPSDQRIDADGRLVTPGLVDSWMLLPEPRERAAAHLADAVLTGTTSVVAIVGSSSAADIVGFIERLGVRTILGVEGGLEEPSDASDTISRLSRQLSGRGVFWMPALAAGNMARWSDDRLRVTMEAHVAGIRRPLPRLIAAAADENELRDNYEQFSCRPVERLRRLGLLGPRTLIGHGNLLDSEEMDALVKTGAWLVSCPRSALRSGHVPLLERMRAKGGNVALGTGDAGPGPLSEIAALSAGMRAGLSPRTSVAVDALKGGASLVGSLLDAPLGLLVPGALADVVVHRWRPSWPIDGGSWMSGLDGVLGADWVIVGGRIVLREGRLLGVDLAALSRAARRHGML